MTGLSIVAAAACSSGAGGSGGGSGGATATSSGVTSTATGTGSTTTGMAVPCDYEGVCGDNTEPACQGCALETECHAELVACTDEPSNACLDLNKCRLDCPDGPDLETCIAACDAQLPAGVPLLDALLVCIFCEACPVSCATQLGDCP